MPLYTWRTKWNVANVELVIQTRRHTTHSNRILWLNWQRWKVVNQICEMKRSETQNVRSMEQNCLLECRFLRYVKRKRSIYPLATNFSLFAHANKVTATNELIEPRFFMTNEFRNKMLEYPIFGFFQFSRTVDTPHEIAYAFFCFWYSIWPFLQIEVYWYWLGENFVLIAPFWTSTRNARHWIRSTSNFGIFICNFYHRHKLI